MKDQLIKRILALVNARENHRIELSHCGLAAAGNTSIPPIPPNGMKDASWDRWRKQAIP